MDRLRYGLNRRDSNSNNAIIQNNFFRGGKMLQNSQHLPIGHILGGHYKITKILGQGGFGIVYKVEDSHQLNKILIIKELFIQTYSFRRVNESTIYSKKDAKELIEKIKKDVVEEVNILSKIQNRNIVQAYGYFEENNTIYSVMEFIYGVDLMEYIKTNSLDEESVKELLFQLIDGLKELHSQNIIHRDIKPQNIMRTNEGVYKLIDFTNNKIYTDKTIVISYIVSQGYTSPELMKERARIGAYSDIYSLGMTLYRILLGRNPPNLADRTPSDDYFQKKIDFLNIHNDFKNIIKKMTELESENRFQNLEEIEKKFTFVKKKKTIKPKVKQKEIDNFFDKNRIKKQKKSKRIIIPILLFGGLLLIWKFPFKVDSKNMKTVWIFPKEDVCKANGGIVSDNGACTANWNNAKKICSINGNKLPSRDDFRKIIQNCGGIPNPTGNMYKTNENNKHYQSCYKKKGFKDNLYYWTSDESGYFFSSSIWGVAFNYGNEYDDIGKPYYYLLSCIKKTIP